MSGLPEDANEILSGSYQGRKLNELYDEHPELFGTPSTLRWEHIPVAMGIAHACADLSVQVHPTEDYAMKHLGKHGKSESWYIVNCEPHGDIVMGHNAKTMKDLEDYIERKDWKGLLKRYPIMPGFYNIQAGTLHAIQKAQLLWKFVCNPSPITYRVSMIYDRLDRHGQLRDTHVDLAKEYFGTICLSDTHYQYRQNGDVTEVKLTDNENFSVFKYVVMGSGEFSMPKPYLGAFVIEGQGSIDGVALKAGDSFLITANTKKLLWEGEMTLLAYSG